MKWIIDSHFWIAFGAVGLTLFTLSAIGEPVEPKFLSLIFISTFFIYNVQTLLKWNRRHKESAKRTVVDLKTTKIITLASGIIMIVLSFQLESEQVILVGFLGLLSLFYAARINWSRKKRTDLRSIPFIKVYLIGLVWAGVCGLLPILKYNTELFLHDYLLVTGLFAFIIGITIPFDIRDLKYDQKDLKTIPQLFGINGAKIISVIFILAFLGIVNMLFLNSYIDTGLYALTIAIAGISVVLCIMADQERSNYYYTGLIDGVLILFALSYFVS